MQAMNKLADWAVGRMKRNNPEHLWVHYSVALALILGLLVATHRVNRMIIDESAIASTAILASHAQITQAQEILLLAEQLVEQEIVDTSNLGAAITRFENTYAALPSLGVWSPSLQAYVFENDSALHSKVEKYVDLARRLETAPRDMQAALVHSLRTLYGNDTLFEGLQQTARLFEAEAQIGAESLTRLQRTILAISAFALLSEAVFIFLPAQLTVQSAIRQLHDKSAVMENSKGQLEQMNLKLEHLVSHDSLTGLPNRSHLLKRLTNMLSVGPNSRPSILFVGLDNFKSLNDTAGHDYGDGVLCAVADAFRNCVDDEDIIARVGGDEFVFVTVEPSDVLAKRVMDSLVEPFLIMGRNLPINASIGHLVADRAKTDPLAMIADAGIALQAAKNAGGNRTQAFTQDLRDAIENMQKLQLELPNAIAAGQIEPWFQPQIRLADGTLHGAEVLARWRHPTRGLMSPDKFLPAAERAGLMIELDHAIWRSAMKHAEGWQKTGIWHPRISLNAAPDTIADPYLIERFLLQLQQCCLGTDQVIVEVLETTLIDSADDMAAINIDSLAECGIALELDDFGTGYASLSKLTQLALAGIKLDRSLVAPLPDPGADSVIRAILALAAELGLHVIAEGIEKPEQAQRLNERGCAVGQGYGFARPMSAGDFAEWLVKHATIAISARGDVVQFPNRA